MSFWLKIALVNHENGAYMMKRVKRNEQNHAIWLFLTRLIIKTVDGIWKMGVGLLEEKKK